VHCCCSTLQTRPANLSVELKLTELRQEFWPVILKAITEQLINNQSNDLLNSHVAQFYPQIVTDWFCLIHLSKPTKHFLISSGVKHNFYLTNFLLNLKSVWDAS
jgi:hypothetical protein